jgi:hypothetical protein
MNIEKLTAIVVTIIFVSFIVAMSYDAKLKNNLKIAAVNNGLEECVVQKGIIVQKVWEKSCTKEKD